MLDLRVVAAVMSHVPRSRIRRQALCVRAGGSTAGGPGGSAGSWQHSAEAGVYTRTYSACNVIQASVTEWPTCVMGSSSECHNGCLRANLP